MNPPERERLLWNLHRRAEEIRDGQTSDIVTGLVVQGGGSRGVYSVAVLRELQDDGLAHAFDHVFGASTGALNASCLLAEQTAEAVESYLCDVATRRFVNWLRWRKIVDVDFLVDDIMTRRRGLRVDRILHSPSTLHVVLTDADTRRAHVVTNKDAGVDWVEVLRATMALPFLYDCPVALNGGHYMDGCMVEPVPLLRAIAAGCTDILVILTVKPSFRTHPGWWLNLLERPLLRRFPPNIHELVRADRELFNTTMDHIEHPHRRPVHIRLHAIYPGNMGRMVRTATIDPRKLKACADMGRADALRFLRS
jgi:predicted patatin/cPLA2 family phospholipase